MVICLERGADLHMAQLMPLPLIVSCFSKIQIEYIERVCLCVPFYYTIVTAHMICDDRLVTALVFSTLVNARVMHSTSLPCSFTLVPYGLPVSLM